MKYIILLCILTSCSANYYLKRAQKLERKAIMMGAVVKTDTVYVDRVVITPEHHIDTLISDFNFTDTLIIYKDKIITKIKVNTVDHTIYESVKCPRDTVRIKVPVTVTKEIETSGGIPWWIWVIIGALGLVVVVLAFKA